MSELILLSSFGITIYDKVKAIAPLFLDHHILGCGQSSCALRDSEGNSMQLSSFGCYHLELFEDQVDEWK